MASGDFPWADPPELRLWRKQTDEHGESNTECPSVLERYGPKDYVQVMSAALQTNTVLWSSPTLPKALKFFLPIDRNYLCRQELSIVG